MDDMLLELSKYPAAKSIIKQLGLPVPMPQPLKREEGAYTPRPLDGRRIALHAAATSPLLQPLTTVLLEAGATLGVPANIAELQDVIETAEAEPGKLFELTPDASADDFDGLVLDATTTESVDELDRLYEFFHPRLRSLNKSGSAVVLGRPVEEAESTEQAAAMRGLEGFVRSLTKELGRYGGRANLITVEREAADERLDGPLRYLLSPRSAYVSGQPVYVETGPADHPAADRPRRVLKGRTAIVTGAARGIGRATARQLAQEGAKVLCVDLPGTDKLGEVADEFGGIPVALDISQPDAPEELADRVDGRGGADIVVHNAGITRDRTLANMSREDWRDSLSVNLEAPIRLTERLLERELVNEWGRIVCLSSVAGIAGNVGQTNYATGKAGFIGFVQDLAERLRGRNITANAVAPGFIETRMTEDMPVVVREVARRMNALSQGGRPGDVANAITFLASPNGQGVNGQVLRVCGGALVGA